MIFTKESIGQQIEELLKTQSGLHVEIESAEKVELSGEIFINCKSKGYALLNKYSVRIRIPLGSDDLPCVIDEENCIESNYPHRYKNGQLCLETDIRIYLRFTNGFSLIEWFNEFVVPYYFSYEFYKRFGEYPFGEREHGLSGIIRDYQELFEETDLIKLLSIMKAISEHRYRGHRLCSCGSGQKLRKCHGSTIMKYYTNNQLKSQVQSDYELINLQIKRQV